MTKVAFHILLGLATLAIVYSVPISEPQISLQRDARGTDTSKSTPQILSAKLEIVLAPKDPKDDEETSKNNTTSAKPLVTGTATLKTKRATDEKDESSKENSEKEKVSNSKEKISVSTKIKSEKTKNKQMNNDKTIDSGDVSDDEMIEERFRANEAVFRAGLEKGIKEQEMKEMIKLNKEKQSEKDIKEEKSQ